MSKTLSPNHAVAIAWTEMMASLNVQSTLREGTPSLTNYALGAFDQKAVIDRLLDSKSTYFAHKDILIAGLCAWTVCPHAPHLVQEAMVLAGMSRMASLEVDRQARFPQDPFLADIVARIAGPGIDFYRDFYYPMGGLSRVLSARSPELLKRAIEEASENIGFAVEMMRVCHYHALHLQDRAYFRKASVIGAADVISNMLNSSRKERSPINSILNFNRPQRSADRTNCARYAGPFQDSAALLYSAHSILVGKRSFLDIMRTEQINFEKYGYLLDEWIGRAVYAANTIIKPMYNRQSSAEQIGFLPKLKPTMIEPPMYGSEAKLVKSIFSIKQARARA